MRATKRFAPAQVLLSSVIGSGLAATLILLLAIPGWAQRERAAGKDGFNPFPYRADPPDITLRGTVTAGSRPVTGATVRLKNPNTGMTIARSSTSNTGHFEISGLQPGEYILVAEYQTRTVEDRISVMALQPDIEIRFPSQMATTPTVSAVDLLVPRKAQHKLEEAQKALGKGEVTQAQQLIGKALDIAPRYPAALTLRAAIRLARGDSSGAFSDLDGAIRIDPGYPFAYFMMGAALNSASRFADAERSLEQGLRLAPQAWQGHFESARALLGTGQPASALKELDRALETVPRDFADIHLLRGTTLLTLHRYDESAQELEKFLKLRPQTPLSGRVKQWLQQAQAHAAQPGSAE